MSSSDSHTNLRKKSEPRSGSSNQFSNEDIKDILRSWLLENERTLLAQKNVGEFNGVMMQWFHWYTDDDGNHWNKLKEEAANIARAGITALWLPPAYKGMNGAKDVGYATYDLFDLGEKMYQLQFPHVAPKKPLKDRVGCCSENLLHKMYL